VSTRDINSYSEDGTLLDAYLDGTLGAAERASFERRLATDATLAGEVNLQRRIDARLGVLMAPPALAPVAAREPLPASRGASSTSRIGNWRAIPRWARLAAVLALVALGVWGAVVQPWRGFSGPERSDVGANVVYRELAKGGLKPLWACESDDAFRKFTAEKFGVAFSIAPGQGVEVVGWTYTSGLLESSASVLMCRVDGTPSIVVVGRLADDRRMHAEASACIRIHRKEWSGLVMYEINKRDDAPILERVRGE
jgi:hypothetical protein